jgi:hypothetical protein
MSKSYPYLAIANRYDLDYGDVLLFAEFKMSGLRLEESRQPIREAVKRLSEDANILIIKDFQVHVSEAIRHYRHVQKNGW